MKDIANTALNWLAANRVVWGVPAQNWMLIVGGVLVLYIVALVIAEHRHPRAR
jgi:hypothetical protein